MLFDIAALAIALVLALYGMIKGMVRIVLLFAGLAAGWFVAVRYSEDVALRLGAPRAVAIHGLDLYRLAAFALVFLAVMAVSWLVGWLVTRALGAAHLRWLDRCAGAGLGLLAAILFVCAASIPLAFLSGEDGGAWARGSRLAPYALAGGEYLDELAPEPMRARFRAVVRSVLEPGP
ncbi:MAG TPA: CvpA family protein [Candidatus Polarisedimenticolia bacterium]|nr:CvpA family protein [Candidatus Polarisedimenticolia bacterium]